MFKETGIEFDESQFCRRFQPPTAKPAAIFSPSRSIPVYITTRRLAESRFRQEQQKALSRIERTMPYLRYVRPGGWRNQLWRLAHWNSLRTASKTAAQWPGVETHIAVLGG